MQVTIADKASRVGRKWTDTSNLQKGAAKTDARKNVDKAVGGGMGTPFAHDANAGVHTKPMNRAKPN